MILPTAKKQKCPEILFEAFKKVFLKLAKRKSPIVDDTCLQKLLDTLSVFVVTVESAELSGAVRFLETIKDDPNVGNASQIFGMQVAGRLAMNEEIFIHFENLFQGFYATIFSSVFWQESLSLKTATFHSLRQTMQYPPGFLGMIDQVSDISRETFQAIKDESSIFLTKEASDLIALLIVQCSCIQTGSSDHHKSISEIQRMILERSWDCICNAGSTRCFDSHNPFLKPVFLLLCEANCKDVFSWLAKQENVLPTIISMILKSESTELSDKAIDFYLDLLHNESFMSDHQTKMADILAKLNNKGQVKKLQTFIVKFLKRHSEEEELCENLIQVFQRPLSDIENLISCKSCVEKPPCDPTSEKESFSPVECEKIVSHSIDCWFEILETQIIKKDYIARASKSTSNLLLKIVGILAAKKELQTLRHYQFLNTLASSNRFLVKILQYFCKLSDCGVEECHLEFDCIVKLLHSSVRFVENFEQTPSVISHAFSCILCHLPLLLSRVPEENPTLASSRDDKDDPDYDMNPRMNHSGSNDDKMMPGEIPVIIAEAVNCSLCHPQWEIRDTAVEFLMKVFASCAVSSCLSSWVKKYKLHNSVYSSFSDGESYVRATTISAMTVCLQTDDLWSDFLSVSKKSLDDILQDFIEVLRTDTEAFPRRAAMNFLLETHKRKLLTSSQKTVIYEAVVMILNCDLDWEVKILAVCVWEDVIKTESFAQTAVHAYALHLPAFSKNRCQACKTCTLVQKIQTLSKIGCTNSLLVAVKDCDDSVCQRVGQVLSKLLFSDQEDEDLTIKQTCVKSVAAAKKGEELFNCCTESCCKGLVRDRLRNEGSIFLQRLSEIGFRKDWSESEANCDLYSKDPLSLIEDILADCEETSEDENKIIDCY